MRVPVATVEEFTSGTCRTVEVGRRRIAVWRVGDKFWALRDACPHQGAHLSGGRLSGTMLPSEPATLDYGLNDEVVRCPWHGYEFSARSGEMLFGTGNLRVATYPVAIEDGHVFVDA